MTFQEPVDLDAAPDSQAPDRCSGAGRWNRPIGIGVAAACAVAAIGGAVLESATDDATSPVSPALVATVSLDAVVQNPVPAAVLLLRLDGVGPSTRLATEARVSNGGTIAIRVPVGRKVAPGEVALVRLTVPLNCGPALAASERVAVTVYVASVPGAAAGPRAGTSGHQVIGDIRAVGSGPVGQLGGLCAAADAALPAGWRSPARVVAWRRSGDAIGLTVAGLPADAVRVAWVEADGVLFPRSGPLPRVMAGSAQLTLGPPAPRCHSAQRQVLPTGLEVHVETPTGLRAGYVPVDSTAAQWIMEAFLTACPTPPSNRATTPSRPAA
jgi:hypothetical protein